MKVRFIASQVLQDASYYLCEISPELYSLGQPILFGASIGQHTRHFIEFFQCLLEQITSRSGVIDYAKRVRDTRIETDPSFALQTIKTLSERLSDLNENISCRLEYGEHFEEKMPFSVESSLERELVYNIEHTIHHLAIIKIGIQAVAPEIPLPDHFGVAPSTIQYKKACAQ